MLRIAQLPGFRIVGLAVGVTLAALALATIAARAPAGAEVQESGAVHQSAHLADLERVREPLGDLTRQINQRLPPGGWLARPELYHEYRELGLQLHRQRLSIAGWGLKKCKGDASDGQYRQMFVNAWLGSLRALTCLGDELAERTLEDDSSPEARAHLIHARFDRAPDREARLEQVAELRAWSLEQPGSEHVAQLALNMVMALTSGLEQNDRDPSDPELYMAIVDAVTETGATALHERMRTVLAGITARVQERAKRDAFAARFVDRPLVIEGELLDGGQFTTADLKGKVVLVDFWASWCGACLDHEPRLIAAYANWRAGGLEIVGVNCDESADKLRNFIAKRPEMSWPQLWAPGRWHPVALQLEVGTIPAYFVIDRKGICRSVGNGQDLEVIIPKLLAEPEARAAP